MLEPSELFPEVPNLYEFPSIHSDMIYDEVRVGAYRDAIARAVRPGDVVLDVGTGTGILSFLCLQAGAKHVHAVDRSPVINWAMEIAEANGLSDRITFHPCDSRDAMIDQKVDVIVSELIGHIAFEEGMIESISHAKEHFLKPGGRLIPEVVTLFAAPVSEPGIYKYCIDSWKPKYGIDYSIMREKALKTSYVTDIDHTQLFAPHHPVFSVDFRREDFALEVKTRQKFEIHRDGEVNGLAFWFHSTLADVVDLSSGPWSTTHWKQCFTPFPQPQPVIEGQELEIEFKMVLCDRRSDKFTFKVDVISNNNA